MPSRFVGALFQIVILKVDGSEFQAGCVEHALEFGGGVAIVVAACLDVIESDGARLCEGAGYIALHIFTKAVEFESDVELAGFRSRCGSGSNQSPENPGNKLASCGHFASPFTSCGRLTSMPHPPFRNSGQKVVHAVAECQP